jgi:uracil-DNA glycosylase
VQAGPAAHIVRFRTLVRGPRIGARRRRGDGPLASTVVGSPPSAPASPPSAAERRLRLTAAQGRARSCVRCPQLVAARTTVVFGAGDPDADVLFVGESPGRSEDRQGLPLVGAPGRLLTELLGELGLRREDVYVTTALKCRPPSGRDPLAEELAHCREHLHAQIATIRPKVVCTLGNFATKLLREDPTGIKALHGRAEVRTLGDRTVRLLPVHHPDAALYEPRLVDVLRTDLALVPRLVELPAPPQPEPARPESDPGTADGPTSNGADVPADSGGPGGQLGLF